MKGLRASVIGMVGATLLAATAGVVAAQSPSPGGGLAAPAPFTGHIDCGDQIRAESLASTGGHVEHRGGVWTPSITEISDPRLDGRVTISFDTNEYPADTGGTFTAGTGTWRITTDEGAWQGSYNGAGLPDGSFTTVSSLLVGEGAYEGLAAIWEQVYDPICAWDVRGVIFPDPPPDAPTAP